MLVVLLVAFIGTGLGFLFGKRVSGWCAECGRHVASVRREPAAPSRR